MEFMSTADLRFPCLPLKVACRSVTCFLDEGAERQGRRRTAPHRLGRGGPPLGPRRRTLRHCSAK